MTDLNQFNKVEPRPEKVAVVEEVTAKLNEASAVIVTEYRGMSVAQLASLRRTLKDVGGEYKVYKNTLAKFAAARAGVEALNDLLVGPSAITFVAGDAAAVAKALRDVARVNPLLVIKGGSMGGKLMSAKDIEALAELPSREVLLARFAGALQAPLVKTANLLQALPRNMAYGLKALIDQKSDAAQAA
jgi:large subunit ribosomal protein L10